MTGQSKIRKEIMYVLDVDVDVPHQTLSGLKLFLCLLSLLA